MTRGRPSLAVPIVDMVSGIVTPRRIGEPLVLGIGAAKAEFGYGVMNPANTIREIMEAIGALPWDQREQDIMNLAIQFDPRKNSGEFLEASLWPFVLKQNAKAAAGVVHLNYKSIVESPTPLFAAGDLEFTDGAGVRYVGTDDIDPPTTIHDTSGQTGTASETIGSTNTRIAQKVFILDNDFPQAIRLGSVNAVSGSPLATVRIETDSAGAPSGILADARLEVVGVVLADGNVDVIFAEGAKVATGDYWVVIEVSGGTATFDGGVGGTANQVQFYNGSVWAASAIPVENLNLKLYNGGEFPVVATQLGAAGNIAPDSLGSVRTNSGAAQTLYDTIVDSFVNMESFEGGRDEEDDDELRARALKQAAARGTSSPGGVVFGLLDGTVPGITFVDLLENDTMDWLTNDPILNNATKTGTQSDLIDGVTYTRIAQQFTVTGRRSISAFAFELFADAGSTLTVRIETDAAGNPSGVLASPNFERTGITPGSTNRVNFTFAEGDFIEAGTYWFVMTRTAGTFRMEGSTAGDTDRVKRYTGAAWELGVVDDMAVEIYGGVPPKSFEVFVEGGSDDDVAQGIYALRAPGILPYGPESGNALDFAGRTVVQHFARPTNVDEVVSVVVQVTPEFAGTANDIRDLITEYLAELGIGDTFVRAEAMGRLTGEGDSRTIGIFDVTQFRLGKKASGFALPTDLTSAEVVNLTLNFGERHRIVNPNVDIAVQIDAAPV